MQEPASPVSVELRQSQRDVVILWDDGHKSTYSFRYLRGFCPCAECQGHADGWTFIESRDPKVVSITEVGSYAVNIVWEDGGPRPHATGIYSFEALRELCPCDACVKEQGARHVIHRMPGQRT
jgi:DUF971 family protein